MTCQELGLPPNLMLQPRSTSLTQAWVPLSLSFTRMLSPFMSQCPCPRLCNHSTACNMLTPSAFFCDSLSGSNHVHNQSHLTSSPWPDRFHTHTNPHTVTADVRGNIICLLCYCGLDNTQAASSINDIACWKDSPSQPARLFAS